jgi:succinyl-diaminopimelate desuccinylase
VKVFEGKDEAFCGIVLPEPTDFEVVTAHRGMLWLEVTTKGKTAHGSTPQLGVNAISSMRRLLDELEAYRFSSQPHELLGTCSMSINTIEAGKAINVVPDRCTARIDIRTLPQQNHEDIIEDFRAIFSKLKAKDPDFEADVEVVRSVKALLTDTNCDFIRDFCSVVESDGPIAVGFTTDGPHFAPLDTPVVIFGPGKSDLCHKPDEYIDITDVERGADYFEKVILKFLT